MTLADLQSVYKVIYADPPWPYEGDPDKPQAAGKHYNEMTFEQLAALSVKERLDGHGVICMWATGPKLDIAIDLIRAWGFHYRGVLFNWIKTAKDGHIIEGQGVRPSFTKPTTELVLVGSTQPSGRTLPILDEGMAQVVFGPRPRGEHSAKPDEVRIRIQELWGDVPRLEMFARAKYPGWDAWGLEVDAPMPSALAYSPRLRERLEEYEANEQLREFTASLSDLPQE